METGKLYMRYSENGKPEVIFEPVNGTVFLTVGEIAQLLGCFSVKVTGNIKVVFKSEILREMDVCCHYRYSVPNAEYPERQGILYSLDMVIALAYRINTYNSEIFRNRIAKRICRQTKQQNLLEDLIWN